VAQRAITATVERGDMIAFESPENPSVIFVKRVIGLPGDRVVFSDEQLILNDRAVPTERASMEGDTKNAAQNRLHFKRETLGPHTYTVGYLEGAPGRGFAFTVPSNGYFVLGDNRDNSRDSRYWGVVPPANVVGKVVFVTD
jgi:signal peptidase I